MVFYFFSWVHLHLVDDTRNQTLQETENKPRSTKGSVPHCSSYRRDRRMGEREDGDRCSGVEAGERMPRGRSSFCREFPPVGSLRAVWIHPSKYFRPLKFRAKVSKEVVET